MGRTRTRFRLSVDGVERSCNPMYDGARITEDKNINAWFGRPSISVDLKFVREDYDYLIALAFDKEVTIYFQYSTDGGTTWTTKATGIFTRMDCTVYQDEKRIEVQPQTLDNYRELMDGIDKEFDLLSLSPETETIKYYKRPQLQVYFAGTGTLSNFLGGTFWEVNVENVVVSDAEIVNTYKFGRIADIVYVQGNSDVLTVDISGRYSPEPGFEFVEEPVVFYSDDGRWEMRQQSVVGSGYRWRVFDLSDGSIVYTSEFKSDRHTPYDSIGGFDGPLFTSVSNPSEQVRCFGGRCYGRLLSNIQTIGAVTLETLPTDDIVGDISYTYSYPITDNIINASNDHSANPSTTRFGKFHPDSLFFAGDYFPRFTGANSPYYPLQRSRWTEVSWWIHYTPTLTTLQEDGAQEITISDVYTYDSCINTLLNEITGGQIDFQATSDYSDFLYNNSNTLKGDGRRLFVVPITNILVSDYDQPQKKAVTRLNEMLYICNNLFQTNWFVDGTKFRIEHAEYFRNGKSYSTPNIGLDYSTKVEPRTGKSWDYGQNSYEYDKENIPSRMEWQFMAENSEPFKGIPIDVLNTYVTKGNIETYNSENFTADIDYVNSQSANFSNQGFVIVECELVGDSWVVPFVNVEIEAGEEYLLQNGYLSMAYLHPRYWKYNAPGGSIKMNRNTTTALSTRRTRLQKVTMPVEADRDIMKLVTTGLGSGLIRKSSQNFDTNKDDLEILHDIG